MFNPSNSRSYLTTLVKDAAKAAMPYWGDKDAVKYKKDGSPVTLADPAAEKVILAGLAEICPHIPVIAEEQFEAGLSPDISNAREYWLIDPLDGTKEFIKGTNDFTINMGFIRDGVPIFGLVYLPATNDLYCGGKDIGVCANDEKVTIKSYDPQIGLTLIGNPDKITPERKRLRDQFLNDTKVNDYVIRGSSIKFCMIADGAAHLYPRFVPTYEWDTCAAHAMLLENGGDIIDYKTGQRLQYGKPSFLNGNIITGTNQVLNILNPSLSEKRSIN